MRGGSSILPRKARTVRSSARATSVLRSSAMSSDGLERFHMAQADAANGYAAALAELRTTGKRAHWIWYVFPQLVGLGRSRESRRYGISGRAQAKAYLEDSVLRSRLLEISSAVAERLRQGWPLVRIMGSSIDALKLVSSLSLFEPVSRELQAAASAPPYAEYAALGQVAERILDAAAEQGYPRCAFTARALAESK